MDDYAARREAVSRNPDLPVNWDKVVHFDSSWDKNEETRAKKQEVIDAFDKMEQTVAGQEALRKIMANHNAPMTVKVGGPQDTGGAAAAYNDEDHSIAVNIHDSRSKGDELEKLIVHEAWHAADDEPNSPREPSQGTNEDLLFWHAHKEKVAEDGTRRHWEEKTQGEQTIPPGSYTGHYEKYMSSFVKNGATSREEKAKWLAEATIKQAVIDGATDADARAKLRENVERVRKETGIDLSNEVETYMKSSPETAPEPAPADPSAAPARNRQPAPAP